MNLAFAPTSAGVFIPLEGVCSPLEGHISGRLLLDSGYEERYFTILADFIESAGSTASLLSSLEEAEKVLEEEFSHSDFEALRGDIENNVVALQAELQSVTTCAWR